MPTPKTKLSLVAGGLLATAVMAAPALAAATGEACRNPYGIARAERR